MTTANLITLVELTVMIAVAAATIIERIVPYHWRSVVSIVFFACGITLFVVWAILTLAVTGLAY